MAHFEIDRERYFLQNRHDDVKKDLDKVKLTRGEINSLSVNELSVDKSGWVKVTANLDTGAAITYRDPGRAEESAGNGIRSSRQHQL